MLLIMDLPSARSICRSDVGNEEVLSANFPTKEFSKNLILLQKVEWFRFLQ